MSSLTSRALVGMLELLAVLGVCLFLPAWTLDYWQAWVFLVAFFAPVLAVTLYLVKRDPHLLERRIQAGPGAEKERSQQVVQSLAALAFVAVFVVSATDHRLGWSAVPPFAVLAGDALVVLGFLIVFLVFRENTYTSATIDVEESQTVVSTGPYSVVRHPMYAGALVMLLGAPVALGSWWGLLPVGLLAAVIVWRLIGEERLLAERLRGYSAYRKSVRYRLVPLVW